MLLTKNGGKAERLNGKSLVGRSAQKKDDPQISQIVSDSGELVTRGCSGVFEGKSQVVTFIMAESCFPGRLDSSRMRNDGGTPPPKKKQSRSV